jgi:hypothetical protein
MDRAAPPPGVVDVDTGVVSRIEKVGDTGINIVVDGAALQKVAAGFRTKAVPPSFLKSAASLVLKTFGVALLTTGGAGLFQYVSWWNAERLQAAADIAAKAAGVYKETANAIGRRYYASAVVVDAVQDLVGRQGDAKDALSSSLDRLSRSRFDSYYAMLTSWNENYVRLLTDIDYKLDRPIFSEARVAENVNPISWQQTQSVDCSRALIEQVEKIGFHSHNLKAQFAVIAGCYAKINSEYGSIKQKALAGDSAAFALETLSAFNKKLDDASSMSNVFACYAGSRIEFYNDEKEYAILSPKKVYERVFSTRSARANQQFSDAAKKCGAI